MNSFFITGMGRSGTTLVEKLLCNHKDISIISQPFPLLFVELKKLFLKGKGIKSYFVLNDTLNNKDYKLQEFNDFLEKFHFKNEKVNELFELMKSYSGQKTKRDKLKFKFESELFTDLFNLLVKKLSYTEKAKIFGSKEILCEEFVPHMIHNNIKSIIIVRDPRDVLASVNYPKGEKFLGEKKPSLFLMQTWRKSVDFIKYLNNKEDFYFLKYEDLVSNPHKELKRITDFLGVEMFEENAFDNGILDQNKKMWSSNSSYDNSTSFISQKSVGAFNWVLSDKEIKYVEAVCKTEMIWLGYDLIHKNIDRIEEISSFKDYGIADSKNIPSNFSSLKSNIKNEIERIRPLKNES